MRRLTWLCAAFAADLEDSIRSQSFSSSRVASIVKYIDKLLVLPTAQIQSGDLDCRGTKLWNLASKLKQNATTTGETVCIGRILTLPSWSTWLKVCAVRVFACLLIDYAQQCAHGSTTSKRFYLWYSTGTKGNLPFKTTSES